MSAAVPDARGFTLIELLLAITILGLLMGTICGAIFVVLRTTQFTLDRPTGSQGTVQDALYSSNDQQLADSFFAADVQSSKTMSTPTSAQPSTKPSCATAVTGVTSLVTFGWQDSDGSEATVSQY